MALINNDDQEDFPIYRIMSIYEFYELYVNKRMKFTLLSVQEDPNDGVEYVLNNFYFLISNNLFGDLQKIKKNTYISCWTKNKDSVAMWSLYSPQKESLMVTTSYKKLYETLNKFRDKFSLETQWGREPNSFLIMHGKIQESKYLNIRKYLAFIDNEIKTFKKEWSRKVDAGMEAWDGDNFANTFSEFYTNFSKKIRNNFNISDIHFVKDQSFSHEEEIRATIHAAISSKYENLEQWKSSNDESTVFSFDINNILPIVTYADINDNFIDEISFDPRMPKYKISSLINMMNIELNKVSLSDCFNPVITENIRIDLLDGITESL